MITAPIGEPAVFVNAGLIYIPACDGGVGRADACGPEWAQCSVPPKSGRPRQLHHGPAQRAAVSAANL